jgi:hypothetical protein
MRIGLALFMALHGIAHLVGFGVSWRLVASEEMPFKTTLFYGRLDLGEAGVKGVGIVWLLLAVSFVVAAVGAVLRQPWWNGLATALALASLLLSIASLPDARMGVLVNALVLGALVAGPALAWW